MTQYRMDMEKLDTTFEETLQSVSLVTGVSVDILRTYNKNALADRPHLKDHLIPFPTCPKLTAKQVADRFHIKPKTLANWRCKDPVIPYEKSISGRVVYRTVDVIIFEIKRDEHKVGHDVE